MESTGWCVGCVLFVTAIMLGRADTENRADTPSASPELPRGPASPASVPVDPLEVMNFWMARFREHISNLRFSFDVRLGFNFSQSEVILTMYLGQSADGSAMIRILEPRILPQIGALIDEYFNGVGVSWYVFSDLFVSKQYR
jgi:hypothetical protein